MRSDHEPTLSQLDREAGLPAERVRQIVGLIEEHGRGPRAGDRQREAWTVAVVADGEPVVCDSHANAGAHRAAPAARSTHRAPNVACYQCAALPWTEYKLREQTVLARTDASGALVLEDGRVEVRYKPKDGRAYQAGARNLERFALAQTFPDEHCATAERPAPKDTTTTKSKSSKAKPSAASAATSTAAIVVYADGACTGNPGPAGAGVLIEIDGKRRELSEYLGHGTNNIGELTAILRAAEALAGEARSIDIKTDSQYAIGVLTKGWKAKANQALILDVKKALAALPDVRVTYVPGHAGVPGNERADELATSAVARRGTVDWRP